MPRALHALTFVTGVVDATSFLALGGVFSAMMTGNVVFLGLEISESVNMVGIGLTREGAAREGVAPAVP